MKQDYAFIIYCSNTAAAEKMLDWEVKMIIT